jgi:hypothetical protein
MALIRKIIHQDYQTIRLELVPPSEKFSITNIVTDDKFIEPFDLINKVRMCRISQDTNEGDVFILKKKNNTKN